MTVLQTMVYASAAVSPMSEAHLEALLLEAQRLNRESGITGVLIYSGGNFMQCLEGSPQALDAALARIRASRTHRGIIELLNEPIERRSFADWQMGFKHVQRSEWLALSSARWQRQVDSSDGTQESPGMFLLKNFWRQPR